MRSYLDQKLNSCTRKYSFTIVKEVVSVSSSKTAHPNQRKSHVFPVSSVVSFCSPLSLLDLSVSPNHPSLLLYTGMLHFTGAPSVISSLPKTIDLGVIGKSVLSFCLSTHPGRQNVLACVQSHPTKTFWNCLQASLHT